MIRRQKSSRQFGVCGSALERAPVPHKTSRIRRSSSRRLKRPLAPARRSAAVYLSHHLAAISMAAVYTDAAHIADGVIGLKQRSLAASDPTE